MRMMDSPEDSYFPEEAGQVLRVRSASSDNLHSRCFMAPGATVDLTHPTLGQELDEVVSIEQKLRYWHMRVSLSSVHVDLERRPASSLALHQGRRVGDTYIVPM